MDIFIFLVFGLSHLLCGMQSQPGIDSALRGTLTNGPALLRTYCMTPKSLPHVRYVLMLAPVIERKTISQHSLSTLLTFKFSEIGTNC